VKPSSSIKVLLVIVLISKAGFSANIYGAIMTPSCFHESQASGVVFSNEGEIYGLTHENATGWHYSNSVFINASSPYMVCSYLVVEGDFDGDTDIDIFDLSVFVAHWMDGGCLPWNAWCGASDLNFDNQVDMQDFAEFASLWLQ